MKKPSSAFMKPRECTCEVCGSCFLVISDRVTRLPRACSLECKRVLMRASRAAYADRTRAVEIMCQLNWRTCRQCGGEWLAEHGRVPKLCALCRAEKRQRDAIVCPGCIRLFVPKGPQANCSPECRIAAKETRRSVRRASAHSLKAGGRVCPDCVRPWIRARGDVSIRCQECRFKRHSISRVRELRKATDQAERVNAGDVFTRDRWVCQLCGKRTVRSLRGTIHPRAPELDHIVPLSQGGNHVLTNVQCACRSCNAAKGSKILGQGRMIG